MEPLIELTDIQKTYRVGPDRVAVLRGASLQVSPGEFVAIIGASGSGKSTLLHIAGALETPDQGTVRFRGQDLSRLYFGARDRLRNKNFGFVFQFYHLLPELNVLENVLLPAMVEAPIWKALWRPRQKEALAMLGEFGLAGRLKHRPAQLSGGERQRVAIARALINEPALLMADEPTGNLDSQTGKTILEVLLERHRRLGQAILLVTHDPNVAALANRVVRLQDGLVVASDLQAMRETPNRTQ